MKADECTVASIQHYGLTWVDADIDALTRTPRTWPGNANACCCITISTTLDHSTASCSGLSGCLAKRTQLDFLREVGMRGQGHTYKTVSPVKQNKADASAAVNYTANACMRYTEEATKARHYQEREKQRHNQNHQQTNQATPKQPTNNTANLRTKHPTHHTHQPALHPH